MRDQLKKINDYSFELPKTGKMNVPGKIYSSDNLLSHAGMSSAIKQVADVATLPGIVDSSLAMPDIHWGYGFPIGGVDSRINLMAEIQANKPSIWKRIFGG